MLKMSNSNVIVCSSYTKGFQPPDFFTLVPFSLPRRMECTCIIAVPDGVKCAKNAFEEELQKEDMQPIKKGI